MNKFGKRWITAGICAGMAVLLTTGCSSVNTKSVVATFGDSKVTAGEAGFWLRFNQATTESALGALFGDGNMWEQDLTGTGQPYGNTLKSQVLSDLEEMVILEAHTADYGVELTADEEAAIEAAAQEFLAANSKETLKAMYADEETVTRLLRLNTIRNKMEKAIEADVDTNVTDEEAAQKTIEYVTFSTSGTTDEDGNTVELTDEEKEAIKQQAQDVIDAMKNGSTMEDAVKAVDETKNVNTMSYGEDNTVLAEALKTAADALGDDEITEEPVPYDNGWYVVHMVTTFDEEATEDRKAEIIEERKSDLYSETLEGWEPEEHEVDSDLWAKITFDVGFNAPETESESTAAETEAETTEAPAEETEAETTEAPAEETEAETTEAPAEETEAETTEAPAEETEADTTEAPAE